MSILHIIDHNGLGGAQILLNKIIKSEKSAYLISLRSSSEEVFSRSERIQISQRTNRFNMPFLMVFKYLFLYKPEVLHSHLFKSHAMSLICKLFFPKLKVVFHCHGAVLDRKFFDETLYKLSKFFVSKYVCVSPQIYKRLSELGIPSDKMVVVNNFVDIKTIGYSRSLMRSAKQFKSKFKYIIGFVGRLERVKGCDLLIKAVSELPDYYGLVIIGTGKEAENLKKLSDRMLLDRCIFLGKVSNGIHAYFKLFDVLAITSRRESFGLVIIEAFKLKVPVVASGLESIKNIILDGYNGCIYQPLNLADLTMNLDKVCKNKDLSAKLRLNGSKTVLSYSYNVYYKKLKSVYASL